MRLAAAIVLLLLGGNAASAEHQPQPKSATAAEGSAETKKAFYAPEAKQRGTPEAPLFVKVLPATSGTQPEHADEQPQKSYDEHEIAVYTRELSSYTAKLFWATFVLAGATIVLSFLTWRTVNCQGGIHFDAPAENRPAGY